MGFVGTVFVVVCIVCGLRLIGQAIRRNPWLLLWPLAAIAILIGIFILMAIVLGGM